MAKAAIRAKRKTPSKSSTIRAVIEAAGPAADIKAIKAGLAEKKVKASDALISKLFYSRPGHTKRKVRRGKASRNGHTNGMINTEHLFAAKLLVDRAGGIEPAQAALAGLAKLLS